MIGEGHGPVALPLDLPLRCSVVYYRPMCAESDLYIRDEMLQRSPSDLDNGSKAFLWRNVISRDISGLSRVAWPSYFDTYTSSIYGFARLSWILGSIDEHLATADLSSSVLQFKNMVYTKGNNTNCLIRVFITTYENIYLQPVPSTPGIEYPITL